MSGAKNCPETPRQRMIGMMYLVLTAMLALNVSADILNGFSMVDKSLRTTIKASDVRSSALYDDFQYRYSQNPVKVKEWLDKANMVKVKSDSLYNYIQNFKYEMVRLSDGDKTDPNLEVIQGASDTNAPGLYGLQRGNAGNHVEPWSRMVVERPAGHPCWLFPRKQMEGKPPILHLRCRPALQDDRPRLLLSDSDLPGFGVQSFEEHPPHWSKFQLQPEKLIFPPRRKTQKTGRIKTSCDRFFLLKKSHCPNGMPE